MLDVGRNSGLRGGGSYGLGLAQGYIADKPAIGHSGGVPGLQAAMWYFTKTHMVLAVVANTDSPSFPDAYVSLLRLVVEQAGA